MTERSQTTAVKLRKFAKPKHLERRNKHLNELEMQPIPNQMTSSDLSPIRNPPTLSSPQKAPKIPNHRSTAENFKKLYTDTKFSSSFSGDVQAIANQIESYRYTTSVNSY